MNPPWSLAAVVDGCGLSTSLSRATIDLSNNVLSSLCAILTHIAFVDLEGI